jgi:putative oxidoreductase
MDIIAPAGKHRKLAAFIPHKADLARWGGLPLRLIVGYGFFAHGLAKLEKGPEKFVAIVDALGVPMPHFMAWMAIIVEFAGGLLMLVGAGITLLSLPMIAVLLVAIVTVHFPFGFTSVKLMEVTASGPKFGPPGVEADLLYLACILAMYLMGPDPLSVDAIRAKRRAK